MAPAKKGAKREREAREPRFYPAYDIPAKQGKVDQAPQKLRASLTPGTVLILLAGKFHGKRVVLLKALESGLLLVSGPYEVNGVPLRRVNASYVIATSTKMDVSSVKVDKFTDAYFPKKEKKAVKNAEGEFFAADDSSSKVPVSDEKKADQAALDKQLLAVVNKTPMMKAYLACLFTLKKGMKPHEMVF